MAGTPAGHGLPARVPFRVRAVSVEMGLVAYTALTAPATSAYSPLSCVSDAERLRPRIEKYMTATAVIEVVDTPTTNPTIGSLLALCP